MFATYLVVALAVVAAVVRLLARTGNGLLEGGAGADAERSAALAAHRLRLLGSGLVAVGFVFLIAAGLDTRPSLAEDLAYRFGLTAIGLGALVLIHTSVLQGARRRRLWEGRAAAWPQQPPYPYQPTPPALPQPPYQPPPSQQPPSQGAPR